jgi:hypothetical protein
MTSRLENYIDIRSLDFREELKNVMVAQEWKVIPFQYDNSYYRVKIKYQGNATLATYEEYHETDSQVYWRSISDAEEAYLLDLYLMGNIEDGAIDYDSLLEYFEEMGSATDEEDTMAFDDVNLDAFGRLRVGEAFTIFDSKLVFDSQDLHWDELTTGNGASAHIANNACQRLTTNGSGDTVIRQTKRYFNYQPGKSQLAQITAVMQLEPEPNVVSRLGLFDDDNGLFFEFNGTTFKVGKRSYTSGSPVDTMVEQADWNLDPMDGSGPSGLTLDASKTNIYIIDYQWLGVGRARMGVNIDGNLYYVHQFLHANVETSVYMSTPNLPVRYEIRSLSSKATSMDCICCTVISEGGFNQRSVIRGIDSGTSTRTVGGDVEPLISIALKTGYERATVVPLVASIMSTGNTNTRWALLLNPTYTTPPTYTGISDSPVKAGVGNDAGDISGEGTLIASGYVSNDSNARGVDLNLALTLAADIAGVSDQICLAVQTISGSDSFVGSLGWQEQL